MTLSVIVPVYNEEKRVLEAIARLLECNFVDEIVIVNDGSTDDSKRIIEGILENSSKVLLIYGTMMLQYFDLPKT